MGPLTLPPTLTLRKYKIRKYKYKNTNTKIQIQKYEAWPLPPPTHIAAHSHLAKMQIQKYKYKNTRPGRCHHPLTLPPTLTLRKCKYKNTNTKIRGLAAATTHS